MKLITVHLPVPLIKALDKLVKEERLFPNRAEAIRTAIRDMIKDYEERGLI